MLRSSGLSLGESGSIGHDAYLPRSWHFFLLLWLCRCSWSNPHRVNGTHHAKSLKHLSGLRSHSHVNANNGTVNPDASRPFTTELSTLFGFGGGLLWQGLGIKRPISLKWDHLACPGLSQLQNTPVQHQTPGIHWAASPHPTAACFPPAASCAPAIRIRVVGSGASPSVGWDPKDMMRRTKGWPRTARYDLTQPPQ